MAAFLVEAAAHSSSVLGKDGAREAMVVVTSLIKSGAANVPVVPFEVDALLAAVVGVAGVGSLDSVTGGAWECATPLIAETASGKMPEPRLTAGGEACGCLASEGSISLAMVRDRVLALLCQCSPARYAETLPARCE